MKVALAGTSAIRASAETTWSRLSDASFVASCAPGVESVRELGDGRSEALASFGAGPIRLRFRIEAAFVSESPGSSAQVTLRGRAPGTEFRAALHLDVRSAGAGSSVAWTGSADVHGVLASVGSRGVEAAARAAAEKFWLAFADKAAG